MARKKFSPEQAVAKLRQIEVHMGAGKSIEQASREYAARESRAAWHARVIANPFSSVMMCTASRRSDGVTAFVAAPP
jgi:hypothetical protein